MTKDEILKLVDETKTPQIRAGETHSFNDIWMVVVDGRIFCRQYSFSERSWYSSFLSDSKGAIKCDDKIIEVNGIIPKDLDEINEEVNKAYIEKYDNRLNHYPQIAHQMTGEKYMAKTMELIPII
ncbi:DUF2255 family protein [Sediminitomix flava]|uniref:Uncharacterized protein DUF2255 n=1 Tax=Sediminitomix flava TaxID=379075 RepID=A0A315ZGB5_SEDFL|nr:DUF2255 family protein [Sediminitomix flava]PWJ44372.1 uncharacterized protein DUF2255 [Sediminitomix flava]